MRRSLKASPARSIGALGRARIGLACCATGFAALWAGVSPATAAPCPNEAIRQAQRATLLPDCFAWEQVSPIEKNSMDLPDGRTTNVPADVILNSNATGDAIAWIAQGGFAGSPMSTVITGYASHRSADWSTTPGGVRLGYAGNTSSTFLPSADVSAALVGSPIALAPGAIEGSGNLYRRDLLSGGMTLVATSTDPSWTNAALNGAGEVVYAGTPNFSEVILISTDPLLPEAAGQIRQAYLSSDGHLELISELPDGSLAGILNFAWISEDGARIFLGGTKTALESPMYVRENGVTVPVSVSQRTGDPSTPVSVLPVGVTDDGSEAYFQTHQALTDDAVEGLGLSDNQLYAYHSDSGKLEALTNQSASPGLTSVTLSPEGDTVFLAARGALAPGATQLEIGDPPEMQNLYAIRHGQEPEFVATAAVPELVARARYGDIAISSKGRYVAFQSPTNLTAFDSEGISQVYVYDTVTKDLSCASCPLSGEGTGPGLLGRSDLQLKQPSPTVRSVLDDGSVFVDSPEALLPSDSNGQYDVYRYRAGAQQLISSGDGDYPSFFQESAGEGSSVFFATRNPLVTQDRDIQVDLYVARAGGGIPTQMASRQGVGCEGDSCQSSASTVPGPVAVGSSAVVGAGNSKARRHKPRAKRRHGRRAHAKKRGRHAKKRHGAGRDGGFTHRATKGERG